MFQFPTFAPHCGSIYHYILGCPIQKFPDQSPLTAPRDLSQPGTSFIASTSQGIHHLLLVAYLFLLDYYVYSNSHHFLVKDKIK